MKFPYVRNIQFLTHCAHEPLDKFENRMGLAVILVPQQQISIPAL